MRDRISANLVRVTLTLRHPPIGVRDHIFDNDSITIGTGSPCDLVIDDSTVSNRHCEITRHANGFLIRDLDSTNGTTVNRIRIKEAWLNEGAVIAVGRAEIVFRSSEEHLSGFAGNDVSFGKLVGHSRPMRELFKALARIAPTNATVVIEGETGTGKEVVARAIHDHSSRKGGPFVVFDCSAIPKDLMESELFGHEKGSFTGAATTREGIFELAHGGTLFLDEIGELPIDLQPKLLRAIETRDIRRVGSNRHSRIDVRLVTATNRDLQTEVEAGRFRSDLFYRLSVVKIVLPPLRERSSDTAVLARHFLANSAFNRNPDGQIRVRELSVETFEILKEHDWPGNVRELLNVIERACSFADGAIIEADDLPRYVLSATGHLPKPKGERTEPVAFTRPNLDYKSAKEDWVARFEREYVKELLERNANNISASAREAGLDRKYLRKLVLKHGLDKGA